MTLEKIFAEGRTSFLYEYDLGDSWRHDITLLGTVEGEAGEKIACTAGARACPPEDCGGVTGYYHLLEALSDPDHEDHECYAGVGGRQVRPGGLRCSRRRPGTEAVAVISLRLLPSFAQALLEAVAVAVEFQDMAVVGQAVEERSRQPLVAEDLQPAAKLQV